VFSGVAPGEYKVFAWVTAPPATAEEAASFIEKYEARGRTVSVSFGALVGDVQVEVTP
jgi:hypothetical protein